ncbi:MAG: nucleoside-diphosphate sugar epimerase [Chloroflexi bacterium HGW-Chloroflexi-4]|jgi:dihydroflavonol-4-reductase|nr:MAG: nucleoside-diphosphate sugar epimerase [Chloroflexi bacterium HGW-Chloroflexi-4]
MTRALITGSTGCLGSNLAAALIQRGFEVVGLSYKNESQIALKGLDIEIVEGNILDFEGLCSAMHGVDWVFHVAGIADDWNYSAERVYETNVMGTFNVLSAARIAKVKRFVLTSSAAVIGVPPQLDGKPMNESNKFNLAPCDWIYGYGKVLAERILAGFVAQGMHAVCVEPTAIMGPGDHHFITGSIIQKAVKGELFPFPEGGSNFIDVRDAAQGHIAAAEKSEPGARYILGAHNMTHVECASIICNAVGVPFRYLRLPNWIIPHVAEGVGALLKIGFHLPLDRSRVYLSRRYMYYDNQKAVQELGLKTRPFSETVVDTYKWYLEKGLLTSPRAFQKKTPVYETEME